MERVMRDGAAAAGVEAYLARVPEPQRSALERLRAQIRKAAPEAEEAISYGVPAFRQGRGLVAYAAFKGHCSLFPMSDGVWSELGEDLAPWRTSKGTLQFTPDEPLPAKLVARLVKARIRENAALDAEKKAKTAGVKN
jgi:uncharacterized protein YdhG (YjbR/CyaY superfamily)